MGEQKLSDTWQLDDDNNDGGQGQQQGKDPVRAQLKALERQNKEMAEKLAAAETRNRATSLKEILSEKKLPTKLANLIPPTVEPTTEAVEAWVKDYEDVFGVNKQPTNDAGLTGDTDDGSGGKTDDERQDAAYVSMMNAFNRMSQAGTDTGTPKSKPEELLRLINSPDLKEEDLLKLIDSSGGGYGTG